MLLLLLACSRSAPVPAPAPPPAPVAPLSAAPPIDEGLLDWLDAHAAEHVLLFPLEIITGPLGPGPAAIVGAEHRHAIRLDTTALSMTLDQHLADHCKGAEPCRVWVRGTWGPLLKSIDTDPVLTVRAVEGPLDGAPSHLKLP